jgi:hypothetical protein
MSRFSDIRKRLKNINYELKSKYGQLHVKAITNDRERKIVAGATYLVARNLEEVIAWEKEQTK